MVGKNTIIRLLNKGGNKLSKLLKWCPCKWEITVTLIITWVIFVINPIYKAYYEIFHTRDDIGILGGLIITMFVLIEALLIRLEHYWKWVVLSTFIFTAAAFISRGFLAPSTFSNRANDIIINGAIFLIFTIPAAIVVYYAKKLIKDGFQRQAIKSLPFWTILISILWELFLLWFIFGV